MATIHREGNLDLLTGKVAVVGYGSQGHAHALNLHSASSRRRSSSRPDCAVAHVAGGSTRSSSRCEDATRSDPDFVAEVARAAIEAGATTINLPDTVGYSLPDEHAAFLLEVQRLCPELAGVTLSVHCHDDLGLAVANTLAGVARARRRSSARSTASASAPATPRSRRS